MIHGLVAYVELEHELWNGLAQLRIYSFAIQYTNSVALGQMAQRNVKWYNVHTYGEALCEMV